MPHIKGIPKILANVVLWINGVLSDAIINEKISTFTLFRNK